MTIEYRWAEGQYDRLPALMADLVRRHVAVIATPGATSALAAKAATTTIPIVFGVGDDPVGLGLVASLARPGGNATGIICSRTRLAAKRLGLLHELVPKAVRVAVLVNPATSPAESSLRERRKPPRHGTANSVLKATTSGEIDAAFATLVARAADALFVSADSFFTSRRVQIVTLAARHALPASYPAREDVEVGGLMSYGATFRSCGVRSASTPAASSRARSLPTCQSCSRPSSSSSSTCKPPGRSASKCRRGCSRRADEVIE